MIAAYVVVSETLLINHIKNSITIFFVLWYPKSHTPNQMGGGIHIAQEINVTEDTKHLSRHLALTF